LALSLHSSNEPGELSQWLCHDDSTVNIISVIIIIIIIIIGHEIPTVYSMTDGNSVTQFETVDIENNLGVWTVKNLKHLFTGEKIASRLN